MNKTFLLKILTCSLVFSMFLVLFTESFAQESPIKIRLSVQETAGVNRVEEPVTSGIPLPESANILKTDSLQLTDASNNVIPTQLTVTSRWKGTAGDSTKPIKWILLDFNATIPANGYATYYLTSGNTPLTTTTSLSIQDQTDKFIINTGKAKFQLSKEHFNIFDYVWVDADNDGLLDDPIVSQPASGGIILTDKQGTQFTALLEAPEEILIEEQGPLRSVIKIRGVLRDVDGNYFAPSITDPSLSVSGTFSQPYPNSYVYYNVRFHFYNNKEYVRAFFTLENNGAQGRIYPETGFAPNQAVYFDYVNLKINLSPLNNAIVQTQSLTSNFTNQEDTFLIHQDWNENLLDEYPRTLEPVFDKGIFYTSTLNGNELSSGKTHDGWIDLNNGKLGIGLAIRDFWQNFPKNIAATGTQLQIGLWPQGGYYPYCSNSDFLDPKYDMYCKDGGRDSNLYLFDAGQHKTHEMIFVFYSGSPNTVTELISKSLDTPLMALADSEWYHETQAFGMIAPFSLTTENSEIDEAIQRYELLQSANVYEVDAENGITMDSLKTMNPPHWSFPEQSKFFGWKNYGDFTWAKGTPSMHYDWTYTMLLHYLRSGKRKLFDAGAAMAKHRYDIDQYHGEREATTEKQKWMNHLQFYEANGHSDPTIAPYNPSTIGKPTHTWSGGLALYYLLTGDRLALNALEEVGKGMLNYYGNGGLTDATVVECSGHEIRHEGWSIVNLLNLYRVKGESLYLQTALNIAKNRLLYREQQGGTTGSWGSPASIGTAQLTPVGLPIISSGCVEATNVQSNTFFSYIIAPLVDIHFETNDNDLGSLLVRMADFAKDKYLFGGDFDQDGNYRPLQSTYWWVDGDVDGSIRGVKGEPTKNIFNADLFSYVHKLTDNPAYLEWARKSFRDGIFYYTKGGSIYFDPAFRAKISFYDGYFSETQTKVHGWLGRTNQIYLFIERQLQEDPVLRPQIMNIKLTP